MPGRTSKFDRNEVGYAIRFIKRSGVLSDIAEARREERTHTGPGGADPHHTDLQILVALFLLAQEYSPMWITEVTNLLSIRLTKNARGELGLPLPDDFRSNQDTRRRWYQNVRNAMTRIITLMDPFPELDRRTPTDRAQRATFQSLRDKNLERRRKERLDRFTNLLLEGTFRELPRRFRRQRGHLDVTADQTFVQTAGKIGRSKFDADGKEKKNPKVLEPEMGWHITEPLLRVENADYGDHWGGVLNLLEITSTRNGEARLPSIAIAASMSSPSVDIPEELVRLLHSINERGHTPGRVTTDLDYYARWDVERLHLPTRELGWNPVTAFRRNMLGVHDQVHGAQHIEGRFYCPAMPENLKKASVLAADKEIDEETYRNWIDQRVAYEMRPKEAKVDDEGNQRYICPAYGANAKVSCPLRELTETDAMREAREKRALTSRVDIPRIQKPDLPEHPDECCTKATIKIHKDFALKWRQDPDLRFGSREWDDIYGVDRNTSEGFHGYLKDEGTHDLESRGRRRMRGLAAQQFLITFVLVSANLRKVFSFLQEKKETEEHGRFVKTQRSKTRNSRYVTPWFKRDDVSDLREPHPSDFGLEDDDPPLRT
ncbi:hypothetical protein [Agromyces sp. NPDC058104]|uniref:hypothetical protein n=1 Tax=Agromyces sp. NPDC058104 TaxID=3346342 RepID=UPI0036DDC5D1